MFKRKLTAFIIILTSLSHAAFASGHKVITNYTDLVNALSQGDEVRAIMTINKCFPASKNTQDSNDILGGLNFSTFNKYKVQTKGQLEDVVATSVDMLVQDAQYGAVYNYVRLHVFEDGSAELFSEKLDPNTYKILQSATFNCRLSNGSDQNAIVLYDLS